VLTAIYNSWHLVSQKGEVVKRMAYVELGAIEAMESVELAAPNPQVDVEVRKALMKLRPDLRTIISIYYFDGVSISSIAAEKGISEKEVRLRLRLSKRYLREMLCDFVKFRWGIKVARKCQICSHPERKAIDRLLKAKSDNETWGAFGRRLADATGQHFHPPQVLIAHLKHIKLDREVRE
jgi:hypothetical protein